MSTHRHISFAFLLSLLGLGAVVVLANVWKSGLVVRHVAVSGNRIVETSEILQLAQLEPETKMYELDLMEVQRNVLNHHFVKTAVVERDLPSTLRIRITERTPVAMVHRGDVLYIDDEGVVLPRVSARELFDLPIISGLRGGLSLTIGARITDPDIREALALLSTARFVSKDMYHLLSEVHLRNGGDVVVYTTEGGLPVLFGRGSAVRKFVYLEAFWKNIVRERGTQGLEYVDLRFEDQIVVRWRGRETPRRHSS